MAITKLMHMNTSSGSKKSAHLKNSIDYIKNEIKTEKGKYVGSQNCHIKDAFKEMLETKKFYNKEDGRQGYHFVISFKPGETDEDTAFDIARQFAREYLKDYEVVYAVHNDQNHMHAHIVFNSVSCMTGLKYHYSDGDWEKDIQPMVDRLCIQHGLPPLEYHIDEYVGADGDVHEKKVYSKNFNWNKIIRQDIDECIDKSDNFDDFLKILRTDYKYRINHENRKYIAVKAPGMKKARRLKASSLGEMYSEEAIRTRIDIKNQRYLYKSKGPLLPYERVYKMPRAKRLVYIKYENMTPYQKERLKATMIRKQLSGTNGGNWYKKAKSSKFYTTFENYQYAVKNGFHSQEDVLAKYNLIGKELKKCQGIRNSIRHDINDMEKYLSKLDKESAEYIRLMKQIKAADEEVKKYNTNIKNMRYEQYRCKRLLSEDVRQLLEQHEKIVRRTAALDKDIKRLDKQYKTEKKNYN